MQIVLIEVPQTLIDIMNLACVSTHAANNASEGIAAAGKGAKSCACSFNVPYLKLSAIPATLICTSHGCSDLTAGSFA